MIYDSITHQVIQLHTFTHSFNQSVICSLTHSLTYSLSHTLAQLSTHFPINSLRHSQFAHSLTFFHSFTLSLLIPHNTHSFAQSHTFNYSLNSLSIHSNTHSHGIDSERASGLRFISYPQLGSYHDKHTTLWQCALMIHNSFTFNTMLPPLGEGANGTVNGPESIAI